MLRLTHFSTYQGPTKKSSVGVAFPLQLLSLGDCASDEARSPVCQQYALCHYSGHYTALFQCLSGGHIYSDSCCPVRETRRHLVRAACCSASGCRSCPGPCDTLAAP